MNFLSANLLVLFVILANACFNPYAAELCISIFHLFVITAAFHARVRGSVPGFEDLKETKNVTSPSTCESQYCGEPP